ncbi:hypothetical protein A8C56_08885 [Niabella ginsenosidivorans]|uniref:Transcriptional regulator n=1 Tax=Niabella ginsenosidivorans TaxID=1176587 RepID=A0A1A9I7Z6_9BACT|nr:hypothetical protein A8C56_08885 [Niabella ginsenosidivorans]
MSAGTILISSATMDDENFKQAVVLITEYNEKGAMGFVVNKLFPRPMNELVEFRHSPAFPLYNGGPVDHDHLYFIHRRPGLIKGGLRIQNELYVGGNFQQAVIQINAGILTGRDLKIFVGYCGWDFGELEAEMGEGYWEFADTGTAIFET